MLFGTVAGSLADTLGRKRGALAYVVVYAASCVTKHWRSYEVLMFGRVLGGIATSLLFSVFDSWLVAEHACNERLREMSRIMCNSASNWSTT